jgi:hypothetical protein
MQPIGPMFKRILFTQWLWARVGLLPAALIGFAVPVLSVQPFNDPELSGAWVSFLLNQLDEWSPAYPILAAAMGLLLGLTAWSADHRVRHVYALSLPLPRWQFTLIRLGAGLLLLAVPVVTVWLGALVASAAAVVPMTLQTYPNALAGRFLIASVMSFAVFFAIASGTSRTAGMLLGVVAVVVVAQLFLQLFGVGVDFIGPIVDAFTSWPGPLEVFGGRWLLIDF